VSLVNFRLTSQEDGSLSEFQLPRSPSVSWKDSAYRQSSPKPGLIQHHRPPTNSLPHCWSHEAIIDFVLELFSCSKRRPRETPIFATS
jgi:hypothetical protein